MRHSKILIIIGVLFTSFFSGALSASAITLSPVRFEISADPGQTIVEEMKLMNDSEDTIKLYSSFANFEASGETGSPSFVEPKDGLGTWMSTDDSVILSPGESKTLGLTIRVPKNAVPGGNFATVFWGNQPPSSGEGQIAIGAKTGILVLLSVNGDVDENANIIEYSTVDGKKFYTALPVPFYYRFQNSGGDRIKPEGDIIVRHLFGWVSARIPANQVEGNILPGGTRRFDALWKSNNGSTKISDEPMNFFQAVRYEWKNFAFGFYTAKLNLTYGLNDTNASAKYSFWVIPWQLLIILVIVFILVFVFFGKGIKKYNAWIIKKARASITSKENLPMKDEM